MLMFINNGTSMAHISQLQRTGHSMPSSLVYGKATHTQQMDKRKEYLQPLETQQDCGQSKARHVDKLRKPPEASTESGTARRTRGGASTTSKSLRETPRSSRPTARQTLQAMCQQHPRSLVDLVHMVGGEQKKNIISVQPDEVYEMDGR